MNHLRASLLQTGLLLIQTPIALAATTWYVNGVNGSDSHNCESPLTACKTIGHAISLAASGDAVTIAAATYIENVARGRCWSPFPSICIPYELYGFGGGIYNIGTLTINRTTIAANSAGGLGVAGGGGTYNRGKLTINASTLNGNSANSSSTACGSPCTSNGGGIDNLGTVEINNSTLAGNVTILHGNWQREGGGIVSSGILSIHNSTVSGNLGGIVGAVTLQNSIVANNVSGGINNVSGGINCNGPVTSIFSLSSDGTCHLNGPGDKNNTNPRLGTLGNYGGPTQTIPLLAGSPAIDAGNPSGCTDRLGHLLRTDQRGLPRPDTEDKSGCDMGAYERQSD